MKTKHTEGPWGLSKKKDPDLRQIEDRLVYATVDGEHLHIAEVYQYQNYANREPDGTALANAALIASAPKQQAKIDRLTKERDELLSIVEQEAKIVCQFGDCQKHPENQCLPCKAQSLLTAVAKAEKEADNG